METGESHSTSEFIANCNRFTMYFCKRSFLCVLIISHQVFKWFEVIFVFLTSLIIPVLSSKNWGVDLKNALAVKGIPHIEKREKWENVNALDSTKHHKRMETESFYRIESVSDVGLNPVTLCCLRFLWQASKFPCFHLNKQKKKFEVFHPWVEVFTVAALS